MDSGESVVREIVERVAEREGTDPVALDPPLHSVIDTDALTSLFIGGGRENDSETVVQFTYQGYQVTVDSSESVSVSEPVREPDTLL